MADLVGSITDGVLEKSKSASTEKSSNSALGKDAFLQLLVCQMKNQDPLNPSSDTEFVSQLATFSQLEQLQNLGTTMTNSQAFSLIGKDVIMKTVDSNNSTAYYSGNVDFVTVTNGKAYLSIAGKLYPAENLDSVINSDYMNQMPQVEDTKLTYNIANPKDAVVNVSLGYGEYSASKAIVSINGKEIDEKYVSFDAKNGKMTIKKEAFSDLAEGTYRISLSFNNSIETNSTNKVSLTVENKVEEVKGDDKKDDDNKADNDKKADDDKAADDKKDE